MVNGATFIPAINFQLVRYAPLPSVSVFMGDNGLYFFPRPAARFQFLFDSFFDHSNEGFEKI